MMAVADATELGGVRAWVSWLIASLCLLIQFVVQLQPSAMIGELESAFDLDANALGQLTAAYFVTYLILQVPVGWLLDHVGPRVVLGISMVLTLGGLVWFGYAESLGWATAARVGLGIAGAPAFPAAALTAARWFPARRFALMMGLTEAFTLLGGVFVDLALPQIQKLLGRGSSGLVLGGAAGVMALACFFGLRNAPQSNKEQSQPDQRNPQDSGSILKTVLNARLWIAAIHGGLFFGVVAAFGGLWAAPFLRARLEVSETSAVGLLSILFFAGAVGAPFLGLMSARRSWRLPVLCIASVVCASVSTALIYMPGPMILIVILLGLAGFVAGAFAVDLAVVRDSVAQSRRGLAMGIANLVFGIIGGPLLLVLIGAELNAQSESGGLSPMSASLDQIRFALVWFVAAMVLLVPLGFSLWYLVHRADQRMSREIE